MSTTEKTMPAEPSSITCDRIHAGSPDIASVHLVTLVDLLAEAFVAKLTAANDNSAPSGE